MSSAEDAKTAPEESSKPTESSDEGQTTTDYESDRPGSQKSETSGTVADNEGSSPEPQQERKPSQKSSPAKVEETETGSADDTSKEEEDSPERAAPSAESSDTPPVTSEPTASEQDAQPTTDSDTSAQNEATTVDDVETTKQADEAQAATNEGITEGGAPVSGDTKAEQATPDKNIPPAIVDPAQSGLPEPPTSTTAPSQGEGGGEGGEGGGEGGGEKKEEEVAVSYNYDELKSTPEIVGVPTDDILELYHSFGYECQKRSNLAVLSSEVLAYAAGNLVVLLNLTSRQQTCFRTLGGGGVGAIAVHPEQSCFAVGEKGSQPVVGLYSYPGLELQRVLRGGTEEMYSHMDFSPGDGKLLATVGGNPDFMLTVWEWQTEKIVLRSKAFSQDIYRVTFSPENPGQLTTSGTGHIRFWKMATTFTGLKLQGQLGKFGRTELTDISAYVELPDGKVLSGTEWGNLLLWDGGFIKVEISRKGKKLCHHGMIEAVYLDEGELISAGADGIVRVWDFETIDNADITDESTTFEMDPLTEIKVGHHNVSIKSLAKSVDPDTPTLWYAQDAAGAIWRIDIVASHTRKAPKKLMSFHSGEITGLDCSPVAQQAASIAQDGSVRVYDLPSKEVLCHTHFASGGSSLAWPPLSVDPTASTLLTGHTDGVLRVLRLEEKSGSQSGRRRGQDKCQLSLQHALKPHSKAVSCLAINHAGTILASGGKDCTVFFVSIAEDYKPIGFVRTPSPVTKVQWSAPGREEGGGVQCVLVCCEDGSMLEVEGPSLGDYDTSKSFHLDPLKFTALKFTSIKDRLRAEEEEARQAAERERKRKEKEAAKQRKRELLGDDYHSEDEEEEEEEGEEGEGEGEGEEAPPDDKPLGPSPILNVFYDKKDHSEFWLSMGGYDAGYLYRCSMEGASSENEPYEAPHTVPVPPVGGLDIPLHALTFSLSGDYLFTGTASGVIRIHPLSDNHTISAGQLEHYWALSMHDNHYGAVTDLATSCDDSYLLSGGADGNVFVYQTNLPSVAAPSNEPPAAEITMPVEPGKEGTDIDDPEHYSIEDAKQKAEHDRKVKLAEEKKLYTRRKISSLRRTFAKLKQRNSQLPGHLQLSGREFIMDPDLEEQLKLQTQEKVELVRKEMAWESEKHAVALRKLKERFKDVVECERVVVWAFEDSKQVASFRTAVPSKQFLELLDKIESSEVDVDTPWTSTTGKRRKSIHAAGGLIGLEEEEGGEGSEHSSVARQELDTGRLSKTEARRLKKEQRKKEWQALYESKPDETLDPEETAAMERAQANLGDYKLKSAADYVVPKHLRVSTESKRRQLVLLRNWIFEEKRAYNSKLLALRDRKVEIVGKIGEHVGRLNALHKELPPSLHKPVPEVPTLRPEEVPERRMEYTKESLLAFEKELKVREAAEKHAAAGMGEGFGGFGGFGGGGGEGGEAGEAGEGGAQSEEGAAGDEVKENGEKEEAETEAGEPSVTVEEADGKEAPGSRPASPSAKPEPQTLSQLQTIIEKEKEIRFVYERDNILAEIQQLKKTFNERLKALRFEKSQLDVTMMTADLKHITQFEELQLLKEFEKRETVFTSRYSTKKKDKHEMEAKIEEVQRGVVEKERNHHRLVEQERALEHSFAEAIGENNKFKDFLLKVFRKKIKRAKRKVVEGKGEGGRAEGEGEEPEDSEEEESDSDYLSSSDDDDEAEGEELDDSVCPAGCDQTLFKQASVLREKRLDLEDAITDEKRALDVQRKELEAMKKKAKTMDSHVKNALNDLQAFQLKKQQRLNELDQVVTLNLGQFLHYQPGGEPPTSISNCLVFPAPALEKLNQRIGELSVEKHQEKKRYKELRLKHVRLVREKKEMLAKIAELEARANEVMLLKFGRIVDLDRLEGLSVNHIVEELKAKLRAMEKKANKELASIEAEIAAERRKLAQVTRENTETLRQTHALFTEQTGLEERLNARQKSMSNEVAGGDVFLDKEERQRLVQLVQLQARETEALREEIQLLQRKGGHILPPSQPPAATTQEGGAVQEPVL